VLVAGATGGLGRIAIQLACASGAHVTALVRDAATSQELLHYRRARQPGPDQPRDRTDAVITARTVEGHLTSVFRKLMLDSRDELPAALALVSGAPVPA
jgi:NAD dependent epimerase/dehydratase family enzyme